MTCDVCSVCGFKSPVQGFELPQLDKQYICEGCRPIELEKRYECIKVSNEELYKENEHLKLVLHRLKESWGNVQAARFYTDQYHIAALLQIERDHDELQNELLNDK